MKRINLVKIIPPDHSTSFKQDKYYKVYLGNQIRVDFTNGREAGSFLKKTNDDLNFILLRLNQTYAEVFSHYRKLWFYLNNGANALENERDIQQMFASINKNFDLMVTRGNFPNGNYFIFNYLIACCEYLENIIKILQKVELQRMNFIEAKLLRTTILNIDGLRNEIKDIGKGCSKI